MPPRRDFRTASHDDRSASGGSWLLTTFVVGIVSLLAGVAGFVAPQIFSADAVANLWESAGRSPELSIHRRPAHRAKGQQPVLIPFGEAVFNLAEERLTRHLQLRITLLAAATDQELVEDSVETNRAILMNWLIGYFSDKSLEEIRGAAGVNRARREIQDKFNTLLFADGTERIRDVLFEEFTVR